MRGTTIAKADGACGRRSRAAHGGRRGTRAFLRGFSLVELLVVISIIGLLAGLVLPVMGNVWQAARSTQCANNLRIIGNGTLTYAAMHRGLFPPLCDWREWPQRYWWGLNSPEPDFEHGPLVRYIERWAGAEDGLYECPCQPWGTYIPQGATGGPTTTYGYNGYYLCPAATPGWAWSIGHRPWRSQENIREPHNVFVLADTLMAWPSGVVSSNCLLDPPWIWSGGKWRSNASTTLCYRHMGQANVYFADGSVRAVEPTHLVDKEHMIGYTGESNAPHYVPDWKDW